MRKIGVASTEDLTQGDRILLATCKGTLPLLYENDYGWILHVPSDYREEQYAEYRWLGYSEQLINVLRDGFKQKAHMMQFDRDNAALYSDNNQTNANTGNQNDRYSGWLLG